MCCTLKGVVICGIMLAVVDIVSIVLLFCVVVVLCFVLLLCSLMFSFVKLFYALMPCGVFSSVRLFFASCFYTYNNSISFCVLVSFYHSSVRLWEARWLSGLERQTSGVMYGGEAVRIS